MLQIESESKSKKRKTNFSENDLENDQEEAIFRLS